MQNVSFAVEYAWRVAAEEALQAGSELIEPMHLLIGVCSIEKIFSLDQDSPLQLSGYALASMRFEWQDFVTRLISSGTSPSVLRSVARRSLTPVPEVKISRSLKMSRSIASRAIFTRADALAKSAGSAVLGLVYLFAAMIEKEGAVCDLLLAEKVDLAKLRASVMTAAKKMLQPNNLKNLQDNAAQISISSIPPGQ